MPKVRLAKNSLSFNISTISSGTYTNLSSLVIDSSRRISAINTASSGNGVGAVISVGGDGITTTATTSSGVVTLDLLPVSGLTSGTYIAPKTFAIDQYSRITSITTTTVPAAGVYTGITSLTVDGGGRITAITTGSVAPISYNNTTATSVKYGGISNIQQQAETLYNLGITSGIITLDISSSTNFYFIPNGNFKFNILDSYNYRTTYNPFTTYGNYPSITINVVVDNPNGWSYIQEWFGGGLYFYHQTPWGYNPIASQGSYVQINGTDMAMKWLAGITPTGSFNKTEIYSITYISYNSAYPLLGYGYPFGSLTIYG